MTFPETVSFDIRVTCEPTALPDAVSAFEHLAHVKGWHVDYPAEDGLSYEHTLPGMENVDQIIGD